MHKTWLWTAVILLLIAGGSYGLYVYLRPAPLPVQVLYGNGHVEGTEVRIAAEVAGRVVGSRLVEGGLVADGDLLVRLDDTEPRLNKARAEAEVDALGQERERLERELDVWRHHLRTAEWSRRTTTSPGGSTGSATMRARPGNPRSPQKFLSLPPPRWRSGASDNDGSSFSPSAPKNPPS